MKLRHALCFQIDRFHRSSCGIVKTSNGQDTYTYYNSGRLKQVTRTIATVPTNIYALRYNGLGQFVHKTNNNQYYVYDPSQHLIGEYTSTGDVNQETVYLGDTPVLTLRASAQERTADNTSTVATNKATITGTWTAATTLKGYYGSNYHSHASTNNTATPDNIVYSITPTATQSFKVYARWVAQATNASNATYTVAPNTTGSTPTTITVNQQQNGGTWNYLGSFNLNTANNLTVTLSGQGNGIITADAVRIVPNTPAQTQANVYYIYTDHLNTPREIRNNANQQRWTWYPEQAEAFGANPPNENPQTLGIFQYNLRFPGQLYDPTSQLSYNYYRDYNPRTGRYIESDPIGLGGGINTYGYVGGNPLWWTDPKGQSTLLLPLAVAGAVVLGSMALSNYMLHHNGDGATGGELTPLGSSSESKDKSETLPPIPIPKDKAEEYPNRSCKLIQSIPPSSLLSSKLCQKCWTCRYNCSGSGIIGGGNFISRYQQNGCVEAYGPFAPGWHDPLSCEAAPNGTPPPVEGVY